MPLLRVWMVFLAAGCGASAAQPVVITPPPPTTPSTLDDASAKTEPELDAGHQAEAMGAGAPGAPITGCQRLAIALVLDRSGSMTGQKIDTAKAAARAVVDHLTSDDCVTVVAFDSTPTTTVPLRLVADASAIKSSIDQIQAGGGTELLAAIDSAQQDLQRATRARRKHVVLLTDGQSPTAGLRDLANAMAAQKITLTTIGLGNDTDAQTLKMLADAGAGRYYRVVDVTMLPRIFAREVDLALAP